MAKVEGELRSPALTIDLSPELRSLVKRAVAVLGQVIQEELGDKAYARIESIRRRMTGLRGASHGSSYAVLKETLAELRGLGSRQRIGVAHSFALMLELMNACENAYRTYRLRSSPRLRPANRPDAIIYVLTAHPTEARSPETVAVFHELQRALVAWLREPASTEIEGRLRRLLHVTWRLSLARSRKPTVRDEADSIYSIALREETLAALLQANRELAPVYVRTWVGGDKDGHPGVDERRMLQSLQASRRELLRWVESGLNEVQELAVRLRDPVLEKQVKPLRGLLSGLRRVERGDGGRVERLRAALRELDDVHPAVADLQLVLHLFPGLVMPLELRESSDLLTAAAAGKRGKGAPAITRMLAAIASLSAGGDPKWYARGLIISMASTMEHIHAACRLVRRELGALRVPVIPLFEQNTALEQAPAVVDAMLSDRAIAEALRKHWGDYFEVMVGYSDSAKETGVLKSRLAIAESIHELDGIYQDRGAKVGLKPVFFHGSGGSTDRGGGSIEEQTAWWPESALRLYKATIQGETIERSLASPEITRRRLEQIAHRGGGVARRYRAGVALHAFADAVSARYREKIASPEFLEIVQRATAYRYLSDLRLGSRPAKRGKMLSVQSLRAIPWVLCWTQTRVLFPTWWGVGSAWKALSAAERERLRAEWRTDPLFGSYVKVLGSTLARVELPVFQLYLEHSGLEPEVARATISEFRQEYELAVAFVRAVTGERELLWYKPWLGSSIQLRAPMIHPLNLLQILTLRERDSKLIRETVTGIASGMMTTG